MSFCKGQSLLVQKYTVKDEESNPSIQPNMLSYRIRQQLKKYNSIDVHATI